MLHNVRIITSQKYYYRAILLEPCKIATNKQKKTVDSCIIVEFSIYENYIVILYNEN